MMERKYNIAGVKILFKYDFEFDDRDRLLPFRSEFDKPDFTYEFIIVDELPPAPSESIFFDGFNDIHRDADGVTYRYYYACDDEYRALMTDERVAEGVFTVRMAKKWVPKFVNELRLFDHIAIEHTMALRNMVILHSSYIIHDNKAILFTAPSQTGKSTQADLWHRYMGSRIVNGDRSLIKLDGGKLHACSLPFCGTSGICLNETAPLGAIVVLRQAPFNRVTPLRPATAFRDIYEGIATDIWYKHDVETVCALTEEIIKNVPVLLLECLPDVSAVQLLATELGIELPEEHRKQ